MRAIGFGIPRIWIMAGLMLAGILAGCADSRVGRLNEKAEQLRQEQTLAAAQAGDPEAAFEVGLELCCEPDAGKNTPAATDWLCRAAVQGYGPASHKLGQIYAGRLAEEDAPDPGDAAAPRQLPLAYTWLKIAEGQGAPGADADAASLWSRMSELQRTRARALMESDQLLACRWNEVFARQ